MRDNLLISIQGHEDHYMGVDMNIEHCIGFQKVRDRTHYTAYSALSSILPWYKTISYSTQDILSHCQDIFWFNTYGTEDTCRHTEDASEDKRSFLIRSWSGSDGHRF